MSNKNELLNILSTYYNLQVDILYTMHLLKEKKHPNSIGLYMGKLAADLKYFYDIHDKMKQTKGCFNIPIFNFNDVTIEGIRIKDGYLIGDVNAIRAAAVNLIDKNIDNITVEKSCMLYELGLYSSYLASREELISENIPGSIQDKSEDSNPGSTTKGNGVPKIEEISFFSSIS